MWLVVCLAALTAMENGRKRLVLAHARREEQRRLDPLRQTRITDFAMPPSQLSAAEDVASPAGAEAEARAATQAAAGAAGASEVAASRQGPRSLPTPVEVAGAAAVAEFWRCLHHFADIGWQVQPKRVRERWQRQVAADHPLLALQNDKLSVTGGP